MQIANDRKLWWWLIPVFLLTMGLVLPHLDVDALWHDEFMAYYRSGGGELQPVTVMDTLARTAEDFSWPPGYYLLLAQWKRISGAILFADRILQFFTGMLAISVLYQLGKTAFSRRIAFMAAILLATSAVFIFYMHELRGHVLYVLSVALCLWSYLLVLEDTEMKQRWRQGFFVFSGVLALYSHYVATAAVVAIGLYHIIFERGKPNWNRITFLGVLTMGIYGPWLGILILSLYRRATIFEPQVHTITSLTVWLYVYFNGLLYFVMLPLALASLRWWQNRNIRFLWIFVVLVVAFNIVTNIWTDFLFHPRHLLMLLIPICLFLAFVLDKIWQWQRVVAIAVMLIWIVAGVYYSLQPDFMRIIPTQIPTLPISLIEDIQEVSATCTTEDEAVIFGLVDEVDDFIYQVPFFYYFDQYGYKYSNLYQMQNIRDGELQRLYDVTYADKVALMLDDVSGVWIFTRYDNPQTAGVARLESVLSADGLLACPNPLERAEFQGVYYTNDSSQCERVVSCAGE